MHSISTFLQKFLKDGDELLFETPSAYYEGDNPLPGIIDK